MLMWDAMDRPYELESAREDWAFRLPDGRLGCSARLPREESRRRCQSVPGHERPLLLGIGAGHDVERLLQLDPVLVTVVEADPRSLATARERWRRLGVQPQEDARVRLLCAFTDQALLPMLAEELAGEHGERPVVVHPLCADLWRPHCPEAAGLIEDFLHHRRQAARQESELRANELRNRQRLETARPVDILRGAWGSDAVLVCGAGPGLLDALRLVKHHSPMRIVAVSTALPTLAELGITPDAVVATDPSPLLAADIVDVAGLESIPLVVFPGTSSLLLAAWPGPLVLALPQGPGLRRTTWGEGQPGHLVSGCGTVAAPALDFAAMVSGGPLFVAGVDLAADTQAYAPGVRRPTDLPRPDFAYSRRRMGELVLRMASAGRPVMALGERPTWLPRTEERP